MVINKHQTFQYMMMRRIKCFIVTPRTRCYIKIETISDQYLIPFIVNAISGLQKYFVNKVVDAHTQASQFIELELHLSVLMFVSV